MPKKKKDMPNQSTEDWKVRSKKLHKGREKAKEVARRVKRLKIPRKEED